MRKLFYLTLPVVFLLSCERKPDAEALLDQLVVLTNYDTTATFGSYQTYSIPTDTIGLYSNTTSTNILTQKDEPYVRAFIDAIKANMADRKFQLLSRTENPDLGINVSLVHDFNVYQQVLYGGYGYGAGYYGYGSYYPSYVNTSVTNNGSLVIEVVDLKNKTSNQQVKVIWSATMGDVFNAIDMTQETLDAIDQAFIQSPYLAK